MTELRYALTLRSKGQILTLPPVRFLADVNSRSRSLYAIGRPSVCLSSVTLVRPTQPVEIFGNFFHHTIAQGL